LARGASEAKRELKTEQRIAIAVSRRDEHGRRREIAYYTARERAADRDVRAGLVCQYDKPFTAALRRRFTRGPDRTHDEQVFAWKG
jgi:hypothetical protein